MSFSASDCVYLDDGPAPVVDLVYVRDEEVMPSPCAADVEAALAQARAVIEWCEITMAEMRKGARRA